MLGPPQHLEQSSRSPERSEEIEGAIAAPGHCQNGDVVPHESDGDTSDSTSGRKSGGFFGKMDLFEEFKKLMTTLRESNVDYALCGGFALSVYGIVRATEDLDILVPEDSLGRLRSVIRGIGFNRENPPMEFAARSVRISRFLKLTQSDEDFVILDVLHVTPALEEFWKSRVEVETELGRIVVVSRQGLIGLKRLRGSPIDLSDIASLETTL